MNMLRFIRAAHGRERHRAAKGPVPGVFRRGFVLACVASVVLVSLATAAYEFAGAIEDGSGARRAAEFAIVVTTVSAFYIAIGFGFVLAIAMLVCRAGQDWRRKQVLKERAAKPIIMDGWIDGDDL
jgi:ABC-type transport system involved in cytochrome c biogenesis permease subunit